MARRSSTRAIVAAAIALAAASVAPNGPTTGAGPAIGTGTPAGATKLVPITPIRLADTRLESCGCVRRDAATIVVDVRGRSEIPAEATAVAITITATRTDRHGFVTVYPADVARPLASTLNTRTDGTVANTAIVPLSADGRIAVYGSVPGDRIVDATAVFVPSAATADGRYVADEGRRLADTRSGEPLPAGGELVIPLPNGVAADATAVVVNVTSVHDRGRGFVSARPAGTDPVPTSILNPDGSGLPVAAAAIVPIDVNGLALTTSAGGHLVVDLLGWFTGPSSPIDTAGLFVPSTPHRILDTRETGPRVHAGGTIEIDPGIAGAAAAVTNVTSVHPNRRGYVTAHAAGAPLPPTSTLNPRAWDHTVANLAITPLSARGLAYFGAVGTDVVVDVAGWFTGSPVDAELPARPNTPIRSRVLLVGDSTLAALDVVHDATAALIGFDAVIDAESCRRLLRTSCRSDITGRIPTTVVDVIRSTPGPIDIVVVKAGYNDWFSDFPAEFDAVVGAARERGAHTVVWFTHNTVVSRPLARLAYEENNADLRRLAPTTPDVLLADWGGYSDGRQEWFWDGTHLTASGTWATADYVSRWIAAIEHRPCPRPWVTGGDVPDPCPPPDRIGPVPDPAALY